MAEETPDQRAQRMADRPHHWTIGLSIGAIVVSVAAIGVSLYSAHFAGLQYELAKQVQQDAKDAAAKQASDLERTRKAAEDSAAVAQQALQNSVEGLRLENRPWLEVSSTAVNGGVLVVSLKNIGKSPAYDLRSSCSIFTLTASGMKKVFEFKNRNDGNISANLFGAVTSFIPDEKINGELVPEHVNCEVAYTDRFKETNNLHYCYVVHFGQQQPFLCSVADGYKSQ